MEDILNGWRKRHELVALTIPAGSTGTTYDFPDIPNLRDDITQDIIIVGMEVFAAESVPGAPLNNNPVTPMAVLQNTFLTFYINEEESIRNIPLVRMQPIWQSNTAGALQGGQITLPLECLKVTWNKSYLSFATPLVTLPITFLFGVWYKKLQPGEWNKLLAASNYVQGW